MLENIHRYMKLGIVHFMAYPDTMKGAGPILESVQTLAQDDYFDAIEVTWIQDDQVRKAVRDTLATARMQVAYGAQPRLLTTGMNINDLNEENRQTAVRSLKAGIDEACYLNATGLAFLAGKYAEDTKEASFEALVRSTGELCAYAHEKDDLRVVLEVFDYDIDKKSLIGPAALARRFAARMREQYDNFGLMVDLSHIPMIHETIQEHILPLREYIVHAHIGNTVIRDPSMAAYGDVHPRFGFPNSENDIAEIAAYLKLLLDIGFLNTKTRPIVSFEVKPWGDESPAMVIANAKRTLNQVWMLV